MTPFRVSRNRCAKVCRCSVDAPRALAVVLMAIAACVGCSGGPARVAAPAWDPSGLADAILESLDKNSDGQVDAEELAASPGLAAGARHIDADKNGQLTREELESRFEKYAALGIGLRAPTFVVTYHRQPLVDAQLDFVPEPWLGGVIEPAHGTTDVSGSVNPVSEGADVPGMRLGFYRVKVKSASAKIPEKYTTDASPLGADVSLSDDASSYGPVQLVITD